VCTHSTRYAGHPHAAVASTDMRVPVVAGAAGGDTPSHLGPESWSPEHSMKDVLRDAQTKMPSHTNETSDQMVNPRDVAHSSELAEVPAPSSQLARAHLLYSPERSLSTNSSIFQCVSRRAYPPALSCPLPSCTSIPAGGLTVGTVMRGSGFAGIRPHSAIGPRKKRQTLRVKQLLSTPRRHAI
jgi:hypothetical protein